MPIYEYKCESCGHLLEILQKISDAPARICPDCGQDALKKLVSAAAFKLKGTGWYETDFKDKKSKTDNKSSNTSNKDTAKSGDSSTKKPASDKKDSSKSSTKSAGSE